MNAFQKTVVKFLLLGLAAVAFLVLVGSQRNGGLEEAGILLAILSPVLIGALAGITGNMPFVKSAAQRSAKRKRVE